MFFRTPIGAKLLNAIASKFPIRKLSFFRVTILVLTFLCYFSYHMSRRSFSIVKSVLHHSNCSHHTPPVDLNITKDNANTWCHWKPFDTDNYDTLFGAMDTAYLISYAIFMFISGIIAERVNLRYFLSFGMILSGLLNCAFGIAYYKNIHILAYFLAVQVLSGVFATIGWPSVVAIVGHWFGPSKRGLLFGIWNSHTSFGNVAGAAISGVFVDSNWGLSFIVPGIIIGSLGIFMFFFLIPQPQDIGLCIEQNPQTKDKDDKHQQNAVIDTHDAHAISFWSALKIPGVIEFSLSLFFAKLVSYTFLYWLPMYIKQKTNSSSEESAFLSIAFDIGGVIGGIAAGYIADRTKSSAITCVVMLIFAIPSLYLYKLFGSETPLLNETLQFIAGIFVNGPYSLITTAVCAELGTKVKSKSALATVSAIIDGTGSIGAAVGPQLAGVFDNLKIDWMYMMIVSDILALLFLLRISLSEWRRIKQSKNELPINEKFTYFDTSQL